MPAVTLDLWHTLIFLAPEDEETYMAHQIALGQEVLGQARSRSGAPPLSAATLGLAFERAYTGAVRAAGEGRTVTPAEQILRAAEETGRDVDPREYLARLNAEIDRTPFRVAPGALDLLKELRGLGYRVGVISNTVGEPGAFLRPILTRAGFDRYVETYVFSDEHAWTKPAPEIFRWALDQLDARAEDAVHVGDGWSDIEGARRAGYRGAILYTGLTAYGARYRELFVAPPGAEPHRGDRARQLAEVLPMIRRILAPA